MRGDIEPIIALGIGLISEGYQERLVVPPGYTARFDDFESDFCILNDVFVVKDIPQDLYFPQV